MGIRRIWGSDVLVVLEFRVWDCGGFHGFSGHCGFRVWGLEIGAGVLGSLSGALSLKLRVGGWPFLVNLSFRIQGL